jgi:hypothetical protein
MKPNLSGVFKNTVLNAAKLPSVGWIGTAFQQSGSELLLRTPCGRAFQPVRAITNYAASFLERFAS